MRCDLGAIIIAVTALGADSGCLCLADERPYEVDRRLTADDVQHAYSFGRDHAKDNTICAVACWLALRAEGNDPPSVREPDACELILDTELSPLDTGLGLVKHGGSVQCRGSMVLDAAPCN